MERRLGRRAAIKTALLSVVGMSETAQGKSGQNFSDEEHAVHLLKRITVATTPEPSEGKVAIFGYKTLCRKDGTGAAVWVQKLGPVEVDPDMEIVPGSLDTPIYTLPPQKKTSGV